MYAEPEKSRNPPKAITFPVIYVALCVRVLREATSISKVSPSSDTCDNTLENVGRRAGNFHDGSTGSALGLHGVVMCSDAGRMTTQLGTPRGRYDEYSSKFSLSKKPRFIDPVGKIQT
jgi:hypothetical protein